MAGSGDEQHLSAVGGPVRLCSRYDGSVTPHVPNEALDTGRDLRGRQLAGEDFSAADLRLANLVSANLAGAMFTGADLSRARLHGTRLRHADLDRANLSGVAARDVDLEGASLQGTVLAEADLRGAIFLEADLRGADLRGANLLGADLRGADLTDAILDGAILDGADLARAAVGGGSAIDLRAKAARLRGTTGDLVAAIQAAGALSRPPLRGGLLLAQVTGLISTVLGQAAASITPLLRPLWQLATPLTEATLARIPQLGAVVRALPARTRDFIWGLLRRLGTGIREGGTLATRVRQDAQARLRQAAVERSERAKQREQRLLEQRAAQAAKVQQQLPGGPGADLSGRDFRGERLAFVLWSEANLEGAQLKGAVLDKADLREANLTKVGLVGARLREADMRGARLTEADCEGARLRGALLAEIQAPGINLSDADLRGADLRGADISGARLNGADLRGAQLGGACLRDADLTGARLPDIDLVDAVLDNACFNQADVAGIRWAPKSATGTNLAGALGLNSRERESLRQMGAVVDDIHLERLLGRLDAKPVQIGMGILALGMVTMLTARFLGSEVINPAQIEVNAQALRDTDPLAAAKEYVELAGLARRVEDQVGYLIEAGLLAEDGGDSDEAESLLREAMDAAEDVPTLATETRMRLATFFHQNLRWTESLTTVEPLVREVDQPTEQRARAIVLYDKNRDALGLTDSSLRDEAFSQMGDLPETQAGLRLALAELYTNDGDTSRALAEISQAEALDTPADLQIRIMEARARLLDRTGDINGAIIVWRDVLSKADDGSISAQAAPLAIADLHLRAGRTKEAKTHLAQVLGPDTDERVKGRGLLVHARIAEQEGRLTDALNAYRQVLDIDTLDTETLDEARIAMASLVLSEQDAAEAQSILNTLAPDAISEVMAQAKLGEARSLLDAGEAAEAHPIFQGLADSTGLPTTIDRAARAGLGEALAQMGELRDALDIWRELLAEPGSRHDRIQLELLVANGLLQGGRRKEASTAFRSLADSDNAEARVQGLLGLAEVARASAERERAKSFYRQVADLGIDPVWTVRALAELTDLAAEDSDTEAVLKLTRELLGALPPGHLAAPEYRLSLIAALLQSNALDEAEKLCALAVETAPNADALQMATVACAEVDERAGRLTQALDGYARVLSGDAPQDVYTDAALGIGRCAFELDQPEALIGPLKRTLQTAEAPALRLPLLTMLIRAYQALERPVDVAATVAERNAIAEQIPEIAWTTFIESAGQARSAGDPEQAVALLERAMDLPISADQRAMVSTELGMALIDSGDLDGARKRLVQTHDGATEDGPIQFYSAMGLAEIERRLGKPREALNWLSEITPPDMDEEHTWLAATATALTEAGDPKAHNAWARLAAKTSAVPEARYTAIKGQADALLAEDNAAKALPLYTEARRLATEDWQAGWAAIGEAASHAELGEVEESITVLEGLLAHTDPEVRMEASLRRSGLAADREDWTSALRALEPRAAIALGPAWDASATQARTRALIGAGDANGARAAWRALAARWPQEEEAQLPAWLALSQLSIDLGETADAYHWARKAFKEARDPGYKRQARAMVDALDD